MLLRQFALQSLLELIFRSSGFPDVEWSRLLVIGQYLMWLFLWDDELDKALESNDTSVASDWEKGNEYRMDSIAYVSYYLGDSIKSTEAPVPPTLACTLFLDIVPILKSAQDQIDIGRLEKDLRNFMESSGTEQKLRLQGKLPTEEEYWTFRHGTAAVEAICSMSQ
jgi:hypothetical protein